MRDCIFEQICAVLDQGKIDYVKWDMNRSMADVYAGNLSYDYVLGVYDLWSACAAGIRIFCLRDAAVAAADLTQECFIIPRRSGVVTIPMQSTAQGSSTELRFSIRFPQWGARFGGAEPPDRTCDKFPHPRGDSDGRNLRLRIKPGAFIR